MHSLIQWIKKWIRRIVILFCIVGVVTVICLVASLFSDDSADAPTNEGANSEVTQAPKKRVYRSSAQSKSSESLSAKQAKMGKLHIPICGYLYLCVMRGWKVRAYTWKKKIRIKKRHNMKPNMKNFDIASKQLISNIFHRESERRERLSDSHKIFNKF